MRHDIAKVITEVARSNSSDRSKKTAWRLLPQEFFLDDHGPSKQSGSRYQGIDFSTKNQGDNLGPLRRFLQKRLGQRWEDIYSELCRVLDKRKLMDLHVLVHVRELVEINCCKDQNGQLRNADRHGAIQGFYVDPDSRKLCHKR